MAIGKNLGGNAQSSNDFLLPHAPTITSATDVGTNRPYNNGAIEVAFTLPADSPAATSYTASAYCSVHGTTHTATGTSSPLTIEGFGSEVVTTVDVYGSNEWGDGATATSGSVTVTTVPAQPAAPTGSSPASATYDTVSWTAPANGGSAITGYTVLSNEGETQTATATTLNFPQSANEANTYQVKATNANGDSAYSDASGSITTFSFTPFSFTPFGNFGFTPFGFTPFNNFGFVPFGNFSFTPTFAFTPFNFVPFGNFAFTPFNFVPFSFLPSFLK